MKLARLIVAYKGVKITPRRVKAALSALEDGRGSGTDDITIPILRHVFAREHGWSHDQTDMMTIRQAQQEMALVEEDVSIRTKEANRIVNL